jgi:hypothetical protein
MPQILWDKGMAGAFFGTTVTVSSAGGTASVTACADNINGETVGLLCANDVLFTAGPPANASAYGVGYIQFDAELVGPPASGLVVFWRNTLDGGMYASYSVPAAGIGTTAFTHIALPMADFSILGAILGSMNQVEIQCPGSSYVFCKVEMSENGW